MKKIVSVAVAGVLLLSGIAAFAGCGTEYKQEVDWNVDLSKPIKLKGCYPETGIKGFGKDDTAKIIKEKTGYDVEYDELGANADNEVNGFLINREPYHFMKLTEAQYHPYLAGGTFLDLTEILQNTEAGKILYQLIDLMDYGWEPVTYVDSDGVSHIYGIPDFGYVSMTDSAMIWNRDHLKEIGFEEKYPDTENGLPETVEQVTWALNTLQEHFGSNSSYHALGLPGNNSNEVVQLKGAFEVPIQFYVDENGKIQQYVFSENTTKYAVYMSELRKADVLSSAWQNEQQSTLNQKFANELYSCVFMPYWHMIPLYNSIISIGKIPEKLGLTGLYKDDFNSFKTVKEQILGWQLRVRGDGTGGSVDQKVARIEGGAAGVSYYTVIPNYMAPTALYTIDFLAKKMIYFAEFYGGNGLTLEEQKQYGSVENFPADTHWYEVEAPEGAPTKEDCKKLVEEGKAAGKSFEEITVSIENKFNPYEDLDNRIVFLAPYEFSYTRYYNKDASAGNRLDPENTEEEVITSSQDGMWVKLTERYVSQINNNSQYCNGTNARSARVLFHLRETGFGAWRVIIPTDDTLITNPMAMCPAFEHWAPVSILCRTDLKNAISQAIDAPAKGLDPVTVLDNARTAARTSSAKKVLGVKYPYWSDVISDEMTAWYNDVKLNRD